MRALFYLTPVLIAFSGCLGDPFEGQFECSPVRNVDCESGAICIDNVCRQLCDSVADCEANEVCGVDEYCVEFTENLCGSQDDCIGGTFCDGEACRRKRAAGDGCTEDVACETGTCADGFCCTSECSAACVSCASADTGMADGTCSPISVGTDPYDDCVGATACDGAGACSAGVDGTPCSDASGCSSGQCVDGVCCEQACDAICEACADALTGGNDGSCLPVLSGTDPADDCSGVIACDGVGACFARSQGALCSDSFECVSGFCVDGFCCDSACDGLCEACSVALVGSGADGACAPIGSGLDPEAECTQFGCDGAGACVSGAGNGTACGDPTQCASGFCVDGVCCEAACDSECEACSDGLTGGTAGICAPVLADTDPDLDCRGFRCSAAGACNPIATWAPAVLIESDDTNDFDGLQVGVGGGRTTAVLTQGGDLLGNVYNATDAWSVPVPIETGASAATVPFLSVGPTGISIVTFIRNSGTRDNVRANVFVPGAGWQGGALAENVDDEPAVFAVPIVDAAGNGDIFWTGTGGVTHSSSFTLVAGWGGDTVVAPEPLADVLGLGTVGRDDQGRSMVLTYVNTGLFVGDVRAHRRSTSWQDDGVIASGVSASLFGANARLDVRLDGDAVAAWQRNTDSTIWVRFYEAGIGWQGSHEVPGAVGWIRALRLDTDGAVSIATNQASILYAHYRSPDGTWASAAPLTQGGFATHDGLGNLVAAYRDASDDLYCARLPKGATTWETPVLMETSPDPVALHSVDADETGRIAVG